MVLSCVPLGSKIGKEHTVGEGSHDLYFAMPSIGAKIILACFLYPVSVPYYYRK
ncbi:Transmembrane domain-containing protein [Cedratvirus Zaza IHUMI]|uniref:Transmembrane domain-containing protein n=1 Tax=Cedratvirus Zaza IHUMI TaxID=2126979 RepID=A0A2R8FFR7_9VIRU|nr:Transmembrane domain-containing protein [Cedratvirus Zaza IHUMI]